MRVQAIGSRAAESFLGGTGEKSIRLEGPGWEGSRAMVWGLDFGLRVQDSGFRVQEFLGVQIQV